jgi:[ribosomal protein S5]-alanine N-acetyltransferase
MRTLVGNGLTLEPQTRAHAPEMFDVLSDPAIYEFENEPPSSLASLSLRFERLEARTSKDGSEHWLNWVVKLPNARLAGYVQATVQRDGVSFVAYELSSKHWRQGIGSMAVAMMLDELKSEYGVKTFVAVFKNQNHRSRGLLNKLQFTEADVATADVYRDDDGESVMTKHA